MATVKENLIAARALIDTPARWCKGTASVRRGWFPWLNMYPLGWTAFCQVGACMAAAGGRYWIAKPSLDLLIECGGGASFNDHPETTHADIMALFDRAIAAQP